MAKKADKSYLSALAATAPAFTAKALFGDLPKGALESVVQGKLSKSPNTARQLLSQGLRGRGFGRALGGGVGVLSAPIFLKGLSLVGSKDPSERRKGLAMIGSTSAVYSSQKGFLEGFRSSKALGKPSPLAVSRGLTLGATRAAYKTPQALLLGLGIAAGRKKSKKSKDETSKYLLPALAGSALGAGSRGIESAVQSSIDLRGTGMARAAKLRKILQRALPAAGGGAAGGLFGGLVLAGVVEGATRAMNKKASNEKTAALLDPLTLGTAATKGVLDVLGMHALTKGGLGYGKVGQFFARTPGLRKIPLMYQKAQSRQLAIGIREGIAGRATQGYRSTAALSITFPELQVQRQLGLKLGNYLRGLPPEWRETALKTVGGGIAKRPHMMTSRRGSPTGLHVFPEGIKMALGGKPLYEGTGPLTKAWKKVMLGGRGAVDQTVAGKIKKLHGLPMAGAMDKPVLKGAVEDLSSMAGWAGAGLATGGMPGAFMLAHGGWSGLKGLVAKHQAVEAAAKGMTAKGIRRALFPSARVQTGGNMLLDYAVSPAARDMSRMSEGLVAGIGGELAAGAKRRGAEALKGAMLPKPIGLRDLSMPAAGAIGLGSLGVLQDKRLRRMGGA